MSALRAHRMLGRASGPALPALTGRASGGDI